MGFVRVVASVHPSSGYVFRLIAPADPWRPLPAQLPAPDGFLTGEVTRIDVRSRASTLRSRATRRAVRRSGG